MTAKRKRLPTACVPPFIARSRREAAGDAFGLGVSVSLWLVQDGCAAAPRC